MLHSVVLFPTLLYYVLESYVRIQKLAKVLRTNLCTGLVQEDVKHGCIHVLSFIHHDDVILTQHGFVQLPQLELPILIKGITSTVMHIKNKIKLWINSIYIRSIYNKMFKYYQREILVNLLEMKVSKNKFMV